MVTFAEAPPLSREGPVKIERAANFIFSVTATCGRGAHAFDHVWTFDRAEHRITHIQTTEQLGVKVMAVASQAFRSHAETGCSETPRVTVSDGEHVFDVPTVT